MKTIFGTLGAFLLVAAAILGLSWLAEGNNFFLYKYFAPKQENVRRKVFENTQSYIEGKIQNIGQECFAHHLARGVQKEALASEIRNEASTVDTDKLPADEQVCVAE